MILGIQPKLKILLARFNRCVAHNKMAAIGLELTLKYLSVLHRLVIELPVAR